MWIYFVEQVWCLSERDWFSLKWTTQESQRCYWDSYHEDGYKHMTVYPTEYMVEGNDYIDF